MMRSLSEILVIIAAAMIGMILVVDYPAMQELVSGKVGYFRVAAPVIIVLATIIRIFVSRRRGN